MIKTQIQLPDALYRELKRVAAEREMSLAELLRRGAEYITQTYRPLGSPRNEWKLPGPFHMGTKGDPFANPEWRYEIHARPSTGMVKEAPPAAYGGKKKRKR